MNIWDLVRLTRDNAQTKAEEQKIRMLIIYWIIIQLKKYGI